MGFSWPSATEIQSRVEALALRISAEEALTK
jgi:hypothetical protein